MVGGYKDKNDDKYPDHMERCFLFLGEETFINYNSIQLLKRTFVLVLGIFVSLYETILYVGTNKLVS